MDMMKTTFNFRTYLFNLSWSCRNNALYVILLINMEKYLDENAKLDD